MPIWECECLECSRTWVDQFGEEEEDVRCPFCDSDDIDAERDDAASVPSEREDR